MSDAGSIEIISPENGDGESWYFEVTRYGEVWDGRSATEGEALKDSAVLLQSLVSMQDETGRNHEGPLPRTEPGLQVGRVVYRCPEGCGLVATTETDPNEWAYGHDCEV